MKARALMVAVIVGFLAPQGAVAGPSGGNQTRVAGHSGLKESAMKRKVLKARIRSLRRGIAVIEGKLARARTEPAALDLRLRLLGMRAELARLLKAQHRLERTPGGLGP